MYTELVVFSGFFTNRIQRMAQQIRIVIIEGSFQFAEFYE